MRNNKKAFTLIELTAAIAIMGILSLVIIPNITNLVEKNKKTTYVNDAKRMITLAKKKYEEDVTIKEPTNTQCLVFTLRDLNSNDIETGPNKGEYNKSYSYVTINYNSTTGKYTYGVQLLESYGKKVSSHRGITYFKVNNPQELNNDKVTKPLSNINSFTSLTQLGSATSTNCPSGIIYANDTSTPTTNPSGAKPGDVLSVTYKIGKNVKQIDKGFDTCTVAEEESSCTITLPGFTAEDGYTNVGWSSSLGATNGTNEGTQISITKNETYYSNAIDKTPPSITLDFEEDENYSEQKEVTVYIEDLGTGILKNANIEYGFSKSQSTEPNHYKKANLEYEDGDKSIEFVATDENLNGSYYLWIKPISLSDKNNNKQNNKVVSKGIFNFSGSIPTCEITGGGDINIGDTTTFTLSCTDNLVGIQYKKLSKFDFNQSSNNAEITEVSDPIEIKNGYKYNITVKGKNAGSYNFNLPEKWIINNVATGNDEVVESPEIQIGGIKLTIKYIKTDNVKEISKETDSCMTSNVNNTCDVVLPEIIANDSYVVEGWRLNDTSKILKPGEVLTIQEDTQIYAYAKDSTPPRIVLAENGSSTYTKEKNITVNITDLEDGLDSGMTIKYGFSKDNLNSPEIIKEAQINYNRGDKKVVFEANSKDYDNNDILTGLYYLWIIPEGLSDLNGNKFDDTVISTSTFAFDNTPPICNFSELNDVVVGNKLSVSLECFDEDNKIEESKLNIDNITTLGTKIENISDPIKTEKGYRYELHLKANSIGKSKITIKPGIFHDDLDNYNSEIASDEFIVLPRTLKVKYKMDEHVKKISKTEEICTTTEEEPLTCTITLPDIIPEEGYSVSGWYNSSNTQVTMPGSKYVISSDEVLTAKVMDYIAPSDIEIKEEEQSSCTENKIITLVLKDLGSGLNGNIKLRYGFSKDRNVEPEEYKELTLNSQDKEKNLSIEITEQLDGEYYLWIVPINYKDMNDNINEKTVISKNKFCFSAK